MANIPNSTDLTGSITEGQFKTAINQWRNWCEQLVGGDAITTLTISSNAITPTRGIHKIKNASGFPLENLYTINQTNLPDGSLLWLLYDTTGDSILLWNGFGGAGELDLPVDIEMDAEFDSILLVRSGTKWLYVDSVSLDKTVKNQQEFTSSGTFIAPYSGFYTIEAIGGGGGGGGGGDTGASGTNGGAGESTTVIRPGAWIIFCSGGIYGGGGQGTGAPPAAYSNALLPVTTFAGTTQAQPIPSPMRSNIDFYGEGGQGGVPAGTGSGGAAGNNGVYYKCIEYMAKGDNIEVTIGAGGTAGSGGGGAGNGYNGVGGRVIISW
jgi:hypothetical protein